MPIVIKAGDSPEEVLTVLAPVMHYFGATPSPQDATRFAPFIEPSRAFTAREDGAAVGGCASFPLELTVPGGVVRAAGLTIVGVLPTHRRRGVLRGMMRAQLDDVRHRNEPVATLWASEDTIYGQFGYGMASGSGDIDLAKSAVAFAQPIRSRGAFRILGEAEALAPLAEVYERVRLAQPGMIARGAEWWRNRRLADPENRRQGAGELNRVLLTLDGRPSGYALYRLRPQFEAGNSVGDLRVIEAIGATPEATREIWRFVLDVDWVARVKAFLLPVDHPLFFLLARPREMNFRVHDGLWIRLVDLPAARAEAPRTETLDVKRAILLVDDDPAARRMVKALFARDGHTVEVARNAQHALELLRSRTYDLILADAQARVNEHLFVERLAESHPALKDRILVATGAVTSADATLARLGLRQVRKPFNLRDLRDAAARVWGAGARAEAGAGAGP